MRVHVDADTKKIRLVDPPWQINVGEKIVDTKVEGGSKWVLVGRYWYPAAEIEVQGKNVLVTEKGRARRKEDEWTSFMGKL